MFESPQRKQKQQETDPSTAAGAWASSWQRMLYAEGVAYPSASIQRQGQRTQVQVGYPRVYYDVNAMLSSGGGRGNRGERSPLPLQRTLASEREEKPIRTQMEKPTQLQTDVQTDAPVGKNRTGMPNGLKTGLEQLSGFDLSHVRVHRNSTKPAQLNALAYAQGRDIHLGPGQERQLPHEGWHVVQQLQGRVRPTMALNGAAINDDVALEREADRMGARAARG